MSYAQKVRDAIDNTGHISSMFEDDEELAEILRVAIDAVADELEEREPYAIVSIRELRNAASCVEGSILDNE